MPQLERGVVIAGKYRLTEPLERGGMGAVWVAHHQDLGVDVALKFVLPDAAAHASGQARFRREARAAARLKSPHSAQIYDYGVDQGLAYIVMELLTGHHLGSELKKHRFLPPERVAAICGQVAKALGEAHEAGIVHRDVKPPNIFLAQVAGEEIVKLLDFGIAKVLAVDVIGDHIATDTGTMLGTPRYMSPEQACGDPIDFRSDLFSLAAVAFEALTGERLFTAQHLGELVVQVTNAKVPPLQSVRPGLPEQLDAFFAQALAVNPELRFQSAADFASALLAACAGRAWSRPTAGDETLDGAPRPTGSGDGSDDPHNATATITSTIPAGKSAGRRAEEQGATVSGRRAEEQGATASGTAAAASGKQEATRVEGNVASVAAVGRQNDTQVEGRPASTAATGTAAASRNEDPHIDTATTSVTNTSPRIERAAAGSPARRWPLAAAVLALAAGAWWALSSAQTIAPAHEESVAASAQSASAPPSAEATAVAANPDPGAAVPASASAEALGALTGSQSPSAVSPLTSALASSTARAAIAPGAANAPAAANAPGSPSSPPQPSPHTGAAQPQPIQPHTIQPRPPRRPLVSPKPKPAADGIFDPRPKR